MKQPKWIDKKWLAARLVEYPLLRLLLFTFWFRLVFLLLVGLSVAFMLVFPKIWRVTPPDFVPVVRVSWLDLIQAGSLRRSAERAEQAGKLDDAFQAWLAAMANNPADVRSVQGVLRITLQKPGQVTPGEIRQAVSRGFWLLRLSGNKQSDMDLVTDLFGKLKLHEINTGLIQEKGDLRRPSLQAHYLKGLFHTGQMADFEEMWPKVSPELARHPEISLYHAAWEAGWGPRENRAGAWRQLKEAQGSSETRTLSLQLQLAVSLQQAHEESYHQALQLLAEQGADSVIHHVEYWKLLNHLGKKEEAIRLAKTFPRPPASPYELVSLVEASRMLGLKDQARSLLEIYALEFSFSEQVWITYGDLLMAEKKFEELIPLALRIRYEAQAQDELKAYSYFLEGCALHELGRMPEVEQAFQKCVEYKLANVGMALPVAAEMVRRKFSRYALPLLESIEKSCASNSHYWSVVSSAALSLKDIQRLTTAVTRAYQLNPKDWHVRNNYAATLLASRSSPDIAIGMTVQLVAENPASNTARINHALALLLNRRASEAQALLQAIDIRALNPSEASSYHFAWFQYYLTVSDWESAQQMAPKIDRRFLMPDEEKWLDQAMAPLLPRPAGA